MKETIALKEFRKKAEEYCENSKEVYEEVETFKETEKKEQKRITEYTR